MTTKGTLHHRVPPSAPQGARFHIRIRLAAIPQRRLMDPDLAASVLAAAEHYHRHNRWFLYVMVLMPDHLHAIASFPLEPGMSRTVGMWKHYVAHEHGLIWQRNYFDHRLRNDDEWVEKMHYVRMNPVRTGLCARPEDWPWTLEIPPA